MLREPKRPILSPPGGPGTPAPREVSERERIAEELGRVAERSQLAPPAQMLIYELCSALRNGEPLATASAGWSDFDLVGTFASLGTFDDADGRAADNGNFGFRRHLTVIEVLQGIFIFVPLLITWAGLQQAAGAYHRMLADPATSAAARAGNFLELWQTGFGGHLVSALKFEWAALYTLCAILVLIGITVTAAELRRRADSVSDQDDLQRRSDQRNLLATLARAQLIINRDRLATPARFAAELAGAADGLRALLALAEQTQHATLEVAAGTTRPRAS